MIAPKPIIVYSSPAWIVHMPEPDPINVLLDVLHNLIPIAEAHGFSVAPLHHSLAKG